MGVDEEVVLERQWGGRWRGPRVYASTPEEMQLGALRELWRVVKPGGTLFLAIENRIGLQYFLGHPEDHVNVRFASIMTRRLASVLTRLVRNTDYRTYTYSPSRLASLVEQGNFRQVKLYSVYPHYNAIARMTPFALFDALGSTPLEGDAPYDLVPRIKVFALSQVWKLIPRRARKHLSPSLALVAAKGRDPLPAPRLLAALCETRLIEASLVADHDIVLTNNRFGDGHPVCCIVYQRGRSTPRYFCKVARRENEEALIQEAEHLAYAEARLGASALQDSIPSVCYAGQVDGITLQVTRYIDGQRVGNGVLDALRRIDRVTSPRGRTVRWFSDRLKAAARKRWLARVDEIIMNAINWLTDFQALTRTGSLRIADEGPAWLDHQVERIAANGVGMLGLEDGLRRLAGELGSCEDTELALCMQHGDFDVCNLFTTSDRLVVLDFEHAEREGLATFDLANLVFNPLLQEWRDNSRGLSIPDYASSTGWNDHLRRWVSHYGARCGLPKAAVALLPALGVVEQNGKRYGANREPHDYPMYGQQPLQQMLDWRLDL